MGAKNLRIECMPFGRAGSTLDYLLSHLIQLHYMESLYYSLHLDICVFVHQNVQICENHITICFVLMVHLFYSMIQLYS